MKIEPGTELTIDGQKWFVTRHAKKQVCIERRDEQGRRIDWRILTEAQYLAAVRA